MAERIILCLKYGTAYPAVYVNVLYNACRKAMAGPFRFVCLTDDPNGLVEGVEALPIPDVGLTPQEWFRGGVWPKLGIYDRALHGLSGRCLFIDLDMVVVNDLDAFFEVPGRYNGIDGGAAWGRKNNAVPELCSALVSFDVGGLGDIADKFRKDKTRIMASFRTEQAYTEAELGDEIGFWPEGWVISFKRSLRRPIGLDLFMDPKEPVGAKALAFHGKPRPMALIDGKTRFWDRFPHMGNGPVGWMRRYWLENGGTLP